MRRTSSTLLTCLVLVCLIGNAMAQQAGDKASRARKQRAAPVAAPGDMAALAAFHRALADLEAGRREQVAVLQIGDSHTAADHFSGRIRSLLQQRFGNAGRGFLPPGAPHAWYRPYQVAVTQTAGWRTLTSNKPAPDPADYGLSGAVARAEDPAEVITIDIRSDARLRALDVGLALTPGGGSLAVLADGTALATLPTAGEPGVQRVRLALPANTRRIELRPFGNGTVTVTDHTLVGAARGVTVSNVGFIGAQVGLLSRWNWPRTSAEIATLDPALIILAFGTNEGYAPVGNIETRYREEFERRLVALQGAAPRAALVVVGPPDAARYPRYCLPKPKQDPAATALPPAAEASPPTGQVDAVPQRPAMSEPIGQPPRAAKAPPPEPPADARCEPLTAEERASYDHLLAAEDRSLCRWHTPASFPIVREIQREAAARHGALFFDWFELFDGECGADRWFRSGLAHKDRVHFKQDGYWRAADRLYTRLLAGYRAQSAPAAAPSPQR